MRVFVYFNLHRKVWSLRALEGARRGRVIAHAKTVHLADCTFRVSEAGRQRVLREQRKNVHAGVVGRWVQRASTRCMRQVGYNPYKAATFVERKSLKPVLVSRCARLSAQRQVFIP